MYPFVTRAMSSRLRFDLVDVLRLSFMNACISVARRVAGVMLEAMVM
jgi:hypothetical protein